MHSGRIWLIYFYIKYNRQLAGKYPVVFLSRPRQLLRSQLSSKLNMYAESVDVALA